MSFTTDNNHNSDNNFINPSTDNGKSITDSNNSNQILWRNHDVNNNSQIVTDSNQIFEQDSNADSVVNFDVDIITDHMKGDQ